MSHFLDARIVIASRSQVAGLQNASWTQAYITSYFKEESWEIRLSPAENGLRNVCRNDWKTVVR